MKVPIEERVDRIIREESIENSIERIQGYLEQYYWNQNILNKLGELHFRNGNELLAGKYWFFKENKNHIEQQAIIKFKNSFGNDLKLIARQLIRHEWKSPRKLNQYTKVELLKLLEEINEKEGRIPAFARSWFLHFRKEYIKNLQERNPKDKSIEKQGRTWWQKLFGAKEK